ncbi:hypothetical protein WR25_21722 [Diploscapter pachys]|uniref:Uncharacterized protein n=1 Tax=Diploscapter pachys TaxID=2018661 RepID=A0A2A2L4X2_9BILA|nr:hypothetical protein WR25_21722 [Diploscapter pachys]
MYQARFPNDSNTRRKLRSRCREVKENMSNTIGDQTVEMPVVVGNKTYNLNYTINQRRFHEMLEPQILGTMAIVEDALNNAGLGPEDINNILLVGGSTRIPLIKTLLQQRFGSSKILQNIHPDEAIAIGAAILASQSYPEYNSPEPAPVPKCAIGIDLGTTRCCVAIVDGTGKVQTIPNDLGNTITPSWILYSHGEVKVGSAAINAPSTGKNLIYDSKRLIGRQFNDECVIRDRAGWSFEVVRGNVSDEKGKAMIKITEEHPDGIKDQLIAPEEASGELLKAMKQYAELHLGGQKVTDAVITVPAYFDMRQREATERAAQHAGLTNVRLLTEPTAAAIALAMKKRETNRTILIYDLGGGTFDVSIGRITDQKLEILCIGGDTHLGGEDFDELIVKDFIAHFEKKHEVSFPDDKVMRRRLKNQCREVKENIMGIGSDLSIEMTFNIGGENYPLEYKINRTRFNELCESSFRCTMAIIDNALRNAKLSQDQVNDILLVGGSTRIPRIRELIKEKFPRAGILQNVNPDESIAIGAAIYAAQLGRRDRPSPRPKDANAFDANNSINLYDAAYMTLDICEAIPLSIGMELRGGLVKVVIPRGTPYPTTISQVTRTVMDNQPEFRTDIYEGERARTRDNIKIGTILMNGLKPVPRGSLHVTEFHIDHNGILHVTHTEKCSNRKVNFMIAYDGPRRTATDVAHYLRDAERNREADEQFQRVCDLRRTCETYAHNEKGRIAASTTLPAYKLESAQAIIEEYLVWLGEFPEDYEEISDAPYPPAICPRNGKRHSMNKRNNCQRGSGQLQKCLGSEPNLYGEYTHGP